MAIGGTERMLVEIANATVADGYRVSACITRRDSTLAGEFDPRIKLTVLDRRWRLDISAMWRLAKQIRKEHVNVIHVHGASSFSFLATMKALRLVRVPVVLHDHNGNIDTDNSIPLWFRFLGRLYATQYVGVYENLCKWAARAGISRRRIRLIANAIDMRRVAQAQAVNIRSELSVPDCVLIGTVVGNLKPAKGIDVLIEAVARSSCRERMRLLVVGYDTEPSYAESCRRQARALGLSEVISFLGRRSDSLELLKGSSFAIVPSRAESGPLALIELMACGLPFVATETGSVARKVARLGIPEFVQPGDAATLAKAIDRLIELPTEERNKRGKLGLEVARTHFDIQQVKVRWYEVYREALAGGE